MIAGIAAAKKSEVKARSCILIIAFDTDSEFMLVCIPEIKDRTGHIFVCHQSCESTNAYAFDLHVADFLKHRPNRIYISISITL